MDGFGLYIADETLDFIRITEWKPDRIAPITRKNISFSSRPGAHPQGKETGIRTIAFTFEIEATSKTEWLDKLDEAIAWIVRKDAEEIWYEREPGRTYKAAFDGGIDTREINIYGQVSGAFICEENPYILKEARTADFVDGTAIIQNTGTAPAPPNVVATIANPITYIDVWNGSSYIRLGQPDNVGGETYDPETTVLFDDMGSLAPWTATQTPVDGGEIAGSMASNGFSVSPTNFGVGTGNHGPALKRSVPEAPIEDFSVVVNLIFLNIHSSRRGRIEWYLLDDQGVVMGKIAIKRVGGSGGGNTIEIRLGDSGGVFIVASSGSTGFEFLDFRGMIRLTKKGNMFSYYIAQIDPNTKRHTSRLTGVYSDKAQRFTRKLTQVQLHFSKYNTTEAPDMFATELKVVRHNPKPATGVPIIARAGDVIEMDFDKGQTLLNGEAMKAKRELATSYFKLPPGDNVVMIGPTEDIASASISVRGRTL